MFLFKKKASENSNELKQISRGGAVCKKQRVLHCTEVGTTLRINELKRRSVRFRSTIAHFCSLL